MRNVGNVSGTFELDVTLPVTSWTYSLLPTPSPLLPSEAFTQTIFLSVPGGQIGRDYRVTAGVQCGPYRPSADVTVRLVGPEALAVHQAGQAIALCLSGDELLPPVLDFLGVAVGEGEVACDGGRFSSTSRDRLASAMRATANHLAAYPLITVDDDLRTLAEAAGTITTCAGLSAHVDSLQTLVTELQAQACAIGHHGVSAAFRPGSTFTLLGHPVTYTLHVANRGTLSTTYDVQVSKSASLQVAYRESPIADPFTATLASGETFSATLVVTPTEVGPFTLRADVTAQEASLVHAQATAALRSLDAYLDVLAVSAYPDFVEHGAGVSATLRARIANLTQAPLAGHARTRVWDAAGAPVFTATRPLDFESSLMALQYDLGALDTTDLVTGVYTVTLEVLDANGQVIPRAASPLPLGERSGEGAPWGTFAVGQAVRAGSAVVPSIVPPGDVTVTTIITTELDESANQRIRESANQRISER